MNVTIGRGKAVHANGGAGTDMVFAACNGNAGSGNYRTSKSEVTCKKCLKLAPATVPAEVEVTETAPARTRSLTGWSEVQAELSVQLYTPEERARRVAEAMGGMDANIERAAMKLDRPWMVRDQYGEWM